MHILLSGASFLRRFVKEESTPKNRIGVTNMKIVVWKSPKYLSRLISKLFGVEEKEKKER